MATRLFVPTDLSPGPTFWFEAADQRTVGRPGAGTAVARWDNKGSVTTKPLTQTTGSRQPIYSGTGFNGNRPGITGDGSADLLTALSVASSGLFGASGNTVTLFVAKRYLAGGGGGVVWCKFESGAANRFGLENTSRWDMGDASVAGGQFTSFVDDGNPTVNVYRTQTGTSGPKKFRKNGTDDANTQSLNQAISATTQTLAFFANPTPNNFTQTTISDIVWFNRELTTSEIEQVEAYLLHKLGMSSSLPVGHTYKSAAPTTTIADWAGPYVVNKGSIGTTTAGGATLTLPFTATAGNLLVALVANAGAASAFAASGWTAVDSSTAGTAVTAGLFKKVATGGDNIVTSITGASGAGHVAVVYELANCSDVDVFAKSTTNSGTATRASGTATTGSTAGANELALAFAVVDDYASVDGGDSEAFSNSFDRDDGGQSRGYFTHNPSTGTHPAVATATKQIPSSGTVATAFSWANDATDENILFLVVTKSAGVTGSVGKTLDAFTLAATATTGFPKGSTLTDNFASLDTTTKWTETDSGGDLNVVSGVLEIRAVPAYPMLVSKGTFDCTADSNFTQILDAGTSNGALDGREVAWGIEDRDDNGNQVGFLVTEDLQLIAYYGVSSSWSYPASVAFTAGVLVQIREAAGTTYWEYSTNNGSSWTTLYSRASFSWMVKAKFTYYAGHWNGGESPVRTGKFDNLNIIPSSGVSGSVAKTIDAFTLAATGQQTVQGAVGTTLDAFTLVATGRQTVQASLVKTLDPFTPGATGQQTVQASLAKTLDPFTLAATGRQTVQASVNKTLDPFTAGASGVQTVQASVNKTLDPFTLAASATHGNAVNGAVGKTLDPFTLAATGRQTVQGAVNKTLDPFTLVATGVPATPVTATVGKTLDPFTLTARADAGQQQGGGGSSAAPTKRRRPRYAHEIEEDEARERAEAEAAVNRRIEAENERRAVEGNAPLSDQEAAAFLGLPVEGSGPIEAAAEVPAFPTPDPANRGPRQIRLTRELLAERVRQRRLEAAEAEAEKRRQAELDDDDDALLLLL